MGFISNGLQELLKILFNYTGDLGIAIVMVTLIVKIILIPLSLKQKLAMASQQELANKINYIKEKYKDDSEEMERQLVKCSQESMASMLGCFTILLQLPIVYALYSVFSNMPYSADSILIPWISSLNMSDSLFIIPCIYTLVILAPNLINCISFLKTENSAMLNKQMLIFSVIMSFMITAKTPVAIGIYFITSGIYSLIEDICFRICLKYKKRNCSRIV